MQRQRNRENRYAVLLDSVSLHRGYAGYKGAKLTVTSDMAKKRTLEGYKRKGKRFIPPMKQLPGVREQSYVNDMLPELIWLGLIHDRMGCRFGARTLEIVLELTKEWPKPEKPVNYAMQSAYAELSESQKTEIVDAWQSQHLLNDIQHALAPLVLLYDGFSLAFVGPPSTVISEEALIQRIKQCVGKHLDKYETPGIVLHGAMILTRLIAGTIKFAAHIDIPDFNAVIEKPGTDEAKRAASFMRANAMAEIGMLELAKDWPRYFWNRGAELSPCERPEYALSDD
jgi:hypothetical protein